LTSVESWRRPKQVASFLCPPARSIFRPTSPGVMAAAGVCRGPWTLRRARRRHGCPARKIGTTVELTNVELWLWLERLVVASREGIPGLSFTDPGCCVVARCNASGLLPVLIWVD
jgi:hypothetical protein